MRTSDKFYILQNLIRTPQHSREHQTQGTSEKLSQTRGVEGDMIIKCDVVSWMGALNRKRALSKNEGNLNKVLTSVNNSVPILIH